MRKAEGSWRLAGDDKNLKKQGPPGHKQCINTHKFLFNGLWEKLKNPGDSLEMRKILKNKGLQATSSAWCDIKYSNGGQAKGDRRSGINVSNASPPFLLKKKFKANLHSCEMDGKIHFYCVFMKIFKFSCSCQKLFTLQLEVWSLYLWPTSPHLPTRSPGNPHPTLLFQ